LNIAFDATAILGPMSKNRGIGNYALSQFKTMMELDKINHYYFLNFFEEFTFKMGGFENKNLKEFYFDCGIDRFLACNKDYEEIIGDIIQKFIKENEIDVFYITSPFDGHIFTYKKEWFEGVNVVATIYDIIPYVMKDTYLSDNKSYEWYMGCAANLKWINRLLVISGSVKNDLIKYLCLDEKKIDIIYGAVDDRYRKIDITYDEKKNLYEKFNIKEHFIMCTGGDDSRKNMKELIKAYSKLPESLINKFQLVIVCKLSPNAVQIYTDAILKYGLEERVVLTNFVSDDELLQLYNLASLMAFPSKYEGFGLPVVEAFACGTPVLTSNNSSLGEIAKGAAVLVDPFNIEDITRGLEFILTEADTDQNIKNGYEKLKMFQWSNVATNALCAINQLKPIKTREDKSKKKIAFFTPLPPLESGISDYSVDILNNLSRYFDIDVYIDDNYTATCSLNENIRVYNHKYFKKNSSKYFDILYQVGNSLFHTYMYSYIKKYKGTVVLHDYNMHSVAQAEALHKQKNNMKLYRDYLLEDFSEDVVKFFLDDLKNGSSQLKTSEMELNGFITNYAAKIIVHSDEAREKLLRKNIATNVRTIRSYATIMPLQDAIITKEKYGYLIDDIIISSFGHIHETKRVIPILNAFNRLCRKYENVRYLFVGKLDLQMVDIFQQYIEANALEGRVTVTGYVDLAAFEDYIDLSDICLNLRYPYNGETSGSLMRILSKGKCVIVNNIGSFREIPDDCCLKIPDAKELTNAIEIDVIYDAMETLVANEEYRRKLSESARRYAEEELDINVIAKQYYDYILEELTHGLNEKTLRNIIDYELKPKEYTDNAIRNLVKTLAYSIKKEI